MREGTENEKYYLNFYMMFLQNKLIKIVLVEYFCQIKKDWDKYKNWKEEVYVLCH
jgi:hypothetical protein